MLFINLSNHPSNKWAQEQLYAAKKYDNPNGSNEIADIAFPNIPPDYTTEQVEEMAAGYASVIEQACYQDKIERVIHLAGELSFCFAFAKYFATHTRWANRNITIVTACSDRISTDLGDGKKELHFIFKQFRPLY